MKFLVLLGRILYSWIFLQSGFFHFSAAAAQYAAGNGVPMASVLVPLSGIIALLGGISIVLGFKARWGALLIIVFLIPVTFMMHNFWTMTEPMMRMMQQSMFMKNLSMLGAAFLIAYYSAGPLSIDSRIVIK